MNRLVASIRIIPLVFALSAPGFATRSFAQGTYLYSIAADDGYGLQECLLGGEECGQVVADAWCEAHGHGHALAFGPADRITKAAATAEPDAYTINCGD